MGVMKQTEKPARFSFHPINSAFLYIRCAVIYKKKSSQFLSTPHIYTRHIGAAAIQMGCHTLYQVEV